MACACAAKRSIKSPGAVTTMRGKMLRGERADAACDRRCQHRRRRSRARNSISTCAALIVGAAGVPGRQARQSRPVVALEAQPTTTAGFEQRQYRSQSTEQISHCIREAGIGFHVRTGASPGDEKRRRDAGPRLGTRTIFNLLGPVVQSGRASGIQMVGVFSKALDRTAGASSQNVSAPIACGWSTAPTALDEITTSGPTSVTALEAGVVHSFGFGPRMSACPKVQTGSAARRRRAAQTLRRCKMCSRARRRLTAMSPCSVKAAAWSSPAR